MKQPRLPHSIVIRDTTLREGLDVPGVERRLKFRDRVRLARAIYELGVREFDIVHPGRVGLSSVRLARELKRLYGDKIIVHGAAYAYNEKLDRELALMRDSVDEIDLVMPVIRERKPHANKQKYLFAKTINGLCLTCHADVAKNPHAAIGFSGAGGGGHVLKGRRGKKGDKTEISKDPARPDREFSCSSCHNPHSSDSIRLFRYKANTAFDLCINCHKM